MVLADVSLAPLFISYASVAKLPTLHFDAIRPQGCLLASESTQRCDILLTIS